MSFHHKNNHRWVVTLNHAQARIYQGFEKEAGYQLVTVHDFSKGHHKVPHGKEASTKDIQKRYIHGLANELLQASSAGKFQSLVLVAPHQVLGLLRSQLAPVVKQKVVKEIHKEYPQWLSDVSILRHLEQDVPVLE